MFFALAAPRVHLIDLHRQRSPPIHRSFILKGVFNEIHLIYASASEVKHQMRVLRKCDVLSSMNQQLF